MKIALFHGRGLISCLIRWQTWTDFSHAGVILKSGELIEAWPGGVRLLSGLKHGTNGIRFFIVPGLTFTQELTIETWLRSQIGKNYDYGGVLRFVSRGNAGENGKWFCSELVFEAFRLAGVELFARTVASEVSPGLLSRSPLLVEVPA